jgi:hypothetical protein
MPQQSAGVSISPLCLNHLRLEGQEFVLSEIPIQGLIYFYYTSRAFFVFQLRCVYHYWLNVIFIFEIVVQSLLGPLP